MRLTAVAVGILMAAGVAAVSADFSGEAATGHGGQMTSAQWLSGPAPMAREASHRRRNRRRLRAFGRSIGSGATVGGTLVGPTRLECARRRVSGPSLSAQAYVGRKGSRRPRRVRVSPELGVPFLICFHRFLGSQPIDARVTLPNGTQRQVQLGPFYNVRRSFIERFEFIAFPPDPPGQYTVAATQGPISATLTFTVREPARPRLSTLVEESEPGAIPYLLAGFAPHERVELQRYRRARSPSPSRRQRRVRRPARRVRFGYTKSVYVRYRRPLSLRVDGQGFARGDVVIRRPGLYLLAAGQVYEPLSAVLVVE